MKKEKERLLPFAIVAVISIGVIGVFVMNFTNTGPSDYSQGVLSMKENYFDFSTISMADGKVTHDFELRNDSEENVVIEKVFTSCMCTSATVTTSAGKRYGIFGMHGKAGSNIEIESGDSAIVTVTFDPAAHGPSAVGMVKRMVYLDTNSQERPKLQVSIQANVIK